MKRESNFTSEYVCMYYVCMYYTVFKYDTGISVANNAGVCRDG